MRPVVQSLTVYRSAVITKGVPAPLRIRAQLCGGVNMLNSNLESPATSSYRGKPGHPPAAASFKSFDRREIDWFEASALPGRSHRRENATETSQTKGGET